MKKWVIIGLILSVSQASLAAENPTREVTLGEKAAVTVSVASSAITILGVLKAGSYMLGSGYLPKSAALLMGTGVAGLAASIALAPKSAESATLTDSYLTPEGRQAFAKLSEQHQKMFIEMEPRLAEVTSSSDTRTSRSLD